MSNFINRLAKKIAAALDFDLPADGHTPKGASRFLARVKSELLALPLGSVRETELNRAVKQIKYALVTFRKYPKVVSMYKEALSEMKSSLYEEAQHTASHGKFYMVDYDDAVNGFLNDKYDSRIEDVGYPLPNQKLLKAIENKDLRTLVNYAVISQEEMNLLERAEQAALTGDTPRAIRMIPRVASTDHNAAKKPIDPKTRIYVENLAEKHILDVKQALQNFDVTTLAGLGVLKPEQAYSILHG